MRTLLTPEQTLSAYTVRTLEALIEQGLRFSYATARSYHTATKVTAQLAIKLPIIVHNGAFIVENGTRNILASSFFSEDTVSEVAQMLRSHGISPIVYSMSGGSERYSYCDAYVTEGMRHFLDSRKGDLRENTVTPEQLYGGKVYYFTCIDREEKLAPVHARAKDRFNCVYQKDIYSGAQWLEIMPEKATKAQAALQLKTLLGGERIVAFGDAVNDLSLFAVADECYAVQNADPALKRASTGVIGSNREDGVAVWLAQHAGMR